MLNYWSSIGPGEEAHTREFGGRRQDKKWLIIYADRFEMEMTLSSSCFPNPRITTTTALRNRKEGIEITDYLISSTALKPQGQGRSKSTVSHALVETAASVAIAATVVGAAATYLVKRSKASERLEAEESFKVCDDCGGSGICAECKGEGFVLKRMSEDNAEKARLSAKNMATRYTAGLPKKWSYCTKCTSARNCRMCGGSGRLSL